MREMAQSLPKTPARQGIRRWLPLLAILLGAALFFVFGLQRYLSLDALKANRDWLNQQVTQHLILVLAIYGFAYAAVVTLSLPGATVLTLAGGYMFGQWLGTGITILAASLGATLLFLAARSAFADLLRARAGPWLTRMRDGFKANAFNYLLFLRLVPAFPFFVVNLVPAFLGVELGTFVLATFIGIIPGTFVYASVGAGLKSVVDNDASFSLSHVLTPQILTALIGLALLSLLPVAYKLWRKPKGKAGA
jgi:uncharacterized membrane protein YdjX (TVP38/TMEM64 family)